MESWYVRVYIDSRWLFSQKKKLFISFGFKFYFVEGEERNKLLIGKKTNYFKSNQKKMLSEFFFKIENFCSFEKVY